jgi:ferrous iron transport protein A
VQFAIECKCELVAFTSQTLKPILGRMKSPDSSTPTPVFLAQLHRGEACVVDGLVNAELGTTKDERDSMLGRLRDLGFIPGARCEVIARMWFGGDPIAVRIGGSTFALRRIEAAAVLVTRAAVPATGVAA